jgi:CRISPR/Cas system-associated protein Csm6
MKTAMQELIEWAISLQDKQQQCIDWIVIKNKAESLLEKEKEDLVKAHGVKCHSINQDQSRYVSGEMYYNQTYNQNK